jgi:hypothetical protein
MDPPKTLGPAGACGTHDLRTSVQTRAHLECSGIDLEIPDHERRRRLAEMHASHRGSEIDKSAFICRKERLQRGHSQVGFIEA